jgi:hypothetical protein
VLTLERIAHIGRFTSKTQKHTSRDLVIDRVVLGGTLSGTLLYPSAIPTQVQFKPPKYPVTEHPAQSGEVEVQLWSDSNTNATLTLDYINLSDTVAEQILALWDALYGTYKSLRIPITMLTGVNQQLAVYILTGGKNSQWFFAEVPKWVGKIQGYGDLKVMLISQPVTLASNVGGNFPFIPIASVDDNLIANYTSCDYTGQSPDLTDFTYVRWVGTQWSERNYGATPGSVTLNVTTGWMPLRTNAGQPITYGIGGADFEPVGPYGITISASRYLGPWYSDIDIYFSAYGGAVSTGGNFDVFYLYTANPTEPLRGIRSNDGFGFGRAAPDTSNFATSRGRWEFADSNYNILSTWEGYSKLRPA